jgi:hypothetical protein
MKEVNININEIDAIWDQIKSKFCDPGRYNQIDCFRSMHNMASIIKEEEIEGDVAECGVYLGGNSIWLAKLFPERTLWAFDSYEGVQANSKGLFPHPIADPWNGDEHNLSCSLENVKDNFIKSGVSITNVKFIKGWFRDTLYGNNQIPEKISILRIDSDGYSSYLEVLNRLYEKVVSGGFIIFDDYLFPSISMQALPLFFKDKPNPVIWRADGILATQIPNEVQHLERYKYENNLGLDHIAVYMRKDMPEWKPDMSKYKK